jgi:hypothetical protein
MSESEPIDTGVVAPGHEHKLVRYCYCWDNGCDHYVCDICGDFRL